MKYPAVILLLLLSACTKTSSSPIAEFLKGNQSTVFVFLAPDCPLSQSSTLTLNRIYSQFSSNNVGFYGVFPGQPSDKKAVDGFVGDYKIMFPALLDTNQKLTDFFNATKTPEVFAVDGTGNTFYKGAIDNWAPELGQHRAVVTEPYLL